LGYSAVALLKVNNTEGNPFDNTEVYLGSTSNNCAWNKDGPDLLPMLRNYPTAHDPYLWDRLAGSGERVIGVLP
jgi:hypothetical protein